MKRFLVYVLLIVIGSWLGTLVFSTSAFFAGTNIQKVIVIDENGNQQEFYPLATSVPDATQTPIPTNTLHFVSPTPEETLLPTIPATTVPKMCRLIAAANMRVRSGPGAQYGVIDNWFMGQQYEKEFNEFVVDTTNTYLWGHHNTGWSAIFWYPAPANNDEGEWFIYGGEGNGLCEDVSGWPHNIKPPEPIAEFYSGFHTLAGEGAGILLAPQYINEYTIIKCLDGGWQLCLDAKAANPNIKIVFRTFLHDWARVEYFDKPEEWWAIIEGSLPPGADWYEIQNEHDPPLEYAALWAEFGKQMAIIIERERGGSLLFASSGPGNPDFAWWRPMWSYLDWAAERNRTHGTQHGIAFHASVFAPESVSLPAGSWVNNPFIAGRWKIVCELAEANNYGVSCDQIIAVVTEAGCTDGYQGSSGTFSCYQKGLMYKETVEQYAEIGITGFTWWNMGKIGSWSSDHNCLNEMLK